jgi:hypothetical protein
VIEGALASDPKERFGSTTEMLAVLRDSKEQKLVSFPPLSAKADAPSTPGETDLAVADTIVSGSFDPPEVSSDVLDEPAEVERVEPEAKGVRPMVWLALAIGLVLLALFLILVTGPFEGEQTPSEEQVATSAPLPELPSEPSPEVAVTSESELQPLPALPGPSAESLSWDWLAEMGSGVDPVAALSEPPESTESEPESQASETPRRLIAESARVNERAVQMLEDALRNERIESERVAESRAQLTSLYDVLLTQLVEAKMCSAAQTRLQRARRNLDLMDESAAARLEVATEAVAQCDERAWIAGSEWNASRFLELIRLGGARYEAARALEPPDPDQRAVLLSQSLTDHEAARDMLLSAMVAAEQTDEWGAEMQDSLRWLDARVVAILCALDKCSAAELHLDQALGSLDSQTLDASEDLLSAVRPDVTACKTRSAIAATGFDWPGFLQLVELGTELYRRAQLLLPPPAPENYRVQLRITSRPSGAAIRVDGERIGETPFEGVLESERERVVLSLSRRGYLRARLRVDMTREQVSRHIELEQDLPFGRVQRLGED